MLTKPAKWNIISLGSLFSICAEKCFELWLKNMCTSRICSNELCIILQIKQFWLLLGQIEKIGLLLFRHLVPLPIYRPIFVHVYSVDSLSLSISLSMPSLPLCLSQPFYIVFVFLISNLTAISFRYLLFLLRMTQLSQQKLSAQNEHLCQFKFLFGKAVAALPRNRHRLKEILFSLGKSMKKDRQRRRRRRRRYKNERNLVKVSRWSAANKRATFSSSSLLSFLKRFFWWKFASSTNFERRCSWSLHRRKLFYIFKNLLFLI